MANTTKKKEKMTKQIGSLATYKRLHYEGSCAPKKEKTRWGGGGGRRSFV